MKARGHNLLLWGLLALSVGFGSAARAELFPPLATPEEKIRYLIALQRAMPSIFREAALFEVNLFQLLDDQARLQEFLEKSAEYAKLRAARGPYISLTFEDPKGAAKEPVIDPVTLDLWKDRLSRTLGTLPRSASAANALRSAIPAEIEQLRGIDPESLFKRLAETVPLAHRGEVYGAKSPEARLGQLAKYLPDRINLGTPIGDLRGTIDQAQALRALRNAFTTRDRVRDLVELDLALQENDLAEQSIFDARAAVNEFTPEAAKFLTDREAIRKGVQSADERYKLTRFQKSSGKENFRRDLIADVVQRFPVAPADPETNSHKLTVKELPPHEAILLGLIGHDCLTSGSFAQLNAPLERAFGVYDEHGAPKGYVLGASVLADGKPAFFLRAISGPRLSKAETQLILDGFYDQRAELGYEGVVLAKDKRWGSGDNQKSMLNALISYDAPREVIAAHSNQGKEVSLTYPDAPSRKILEDFDSVYNEKKNRSMDHHSVGALYEPASVAVHASVTPLANPELHYPPASSGDMLGLALILDYMNLTRDLKGLLEQNHLHAAFNTVSNELKNEQKKTVRQFMADAKNALKQAGVSDDWIESNEHVFYQGRSLAPDAMTAENKGKTMDALLHFLRSRRKSSMAERILEAFPESLSQEPRFQNYVLKLLRGNDQSYLFRRTTNEPYEGVGIALYLLRKLPSMSSAEIKAVVEGLLTHPDLHIASNAMVLFSRFREPGPLSSKQLAAVQSFWSRTQSDEMIQGIYGLYRNSQPIAAELISAHLLQSDAEPLNSQGKLAVLSDWIRHEQTATENLGFDQDPRRLREARSRMQHLLHHQPIDENTLVELGFHLAAAPPEAQDFFKGLLASPEVQKQITQIWQKRGIHLLPGQVRLEDVIHGSERVLSAIDTCADYLESVEAAKAKEAAPVLGGVFP